MTFILKLLLSELKCHVTSYSMPKMLVRASILSQYTLFVLPFHTVNMRFTLKLFLEEWKCHVISYSILEMLTRASSLSRRTLLVLPFHTVNVLG